MTDFLVSMDAACCCETLLATLQRPYTNRVPRAQTFAFPWGRLAVMEESRVDGSNILFRDGMLLAWVGDLIAPDTVAISEVLFECLGNVGGSTDDVESVVRSHPLFGQLNGAFAIVFGHRQGLAIVTDLRNFVPVYGLRQGNGGFCGFGTHADSVAALSTERDEIDLVSVGEFLSSGRISFPNSTYENVVRLQSASLYDVRPDTAGRRRTRVACYWRPPKELVAYDERDLVDQLRSALVESVRDRIVQGEVAVQLSGGLDSRLIMALVPDEVDCSGLTFCERPNRETRTAERVARCYGRPWHPIARDPEYLAGTIEVATRFIGCEGEFTHAHAIGLLDEIERFGARRILDGTKLDTYLKGYFAHDIVRVGRMGGLLPATYERRCTSRRDGVDPVARGYLAADMVEQIAARRDVFFAAYADSERSSAAEWLLLNPQDARTAGWNAERRVLPKSLIATDRRIVEFGFRCPMALKAGGRIFHEAVRGLYGPGARIPSANDGVRPESRHLWRLVQRAIRKSQDRWTQIAEHCGRKAPIQHSWHDYPAYWRQSRQLARLRHEYGPNLSRFDGVLFKASGQALLEDEHLFWEHGFRLLQLAVWLGIRNEHRMDRRREVAGAPPIPIGAVAAPGTMRNREHGQDVVR